MLRRCVLALALLTGCGGSPELPAADLTAERFTTRGKVTAIEGNTLNIFHEHIPKMRTVDGTLEEMAPMTMVFSATTAAPVGGIAVGDAVKVEFTTHYGQPHVLRLVSIEKLPAETKLALPAR